MRTRTAAVPASVLVGFALLAIVVANAFPAAGQVEPPPSEAEPFQETLQFFVPGDGGKCQAVPVPSLMALTLSEFAAQASVPAGQPAETRVWLEIRRNSQPPVSTRVPLAMSNLFQTQLSLVRGGHSLINFHTHPLGDDTFTYLMCARTQADNGSQFIGTVSGHAVPIERADV